MTGDTPGARLRRLLASQPAVTLQGCFDAFSARLAAQAGFEALLLGGFAVEATLLGSPDIGIVTLTELAAHAARITAVVDVPVVCDVDTGFGGVNNIARTVRELERAGVAGLHIEDQTTPKRCPVLAGRTLVPIAEAVGRIRAALDARRDPEFVVIARCDADAISYAELVTRSRAYLEAGADLVLPMLISVDGTPIDRVAPEEHMALYRRLVRDVGGPTMAVMIPEGFTFADMAAAGFRIVSTPALSLEAAASAMVAALAEARENGTAARYFRDHPRAMAAGLPIMQALDLDRYLAFERRHGPQT